MPKVHPLIETDELRIGGRRIVAAYMSIAVWDRPSNTPMARTMLKSITVHKDKDQSTSAIPRAAAQKELRAWLEDGLAKRNASLSPLDKPPT